MKSKKTPKATKAKGKGKGKAAKATKVEDETPPSLEQQEEYVEKEYNRVKGQNVVVLSFLTPSLTNTAILKDKIEKTTDLQTKCNLYEELMNEKLSTRAVKILGVFKDEEEARIYVTTELPDYKDFHIFLGDMHKWLAFNEDFCDSREYLDEELSKLLKDHIKDKKEQEQLLKKRIEITKRELEEKSLLET